MQHPDEGTIHAWLDSALSADEAASVEAHVNECAQCQAAVAEARGFIAASSRILTALDNVPRGVTPIVKPKRRIDPMMWRIAATVLVVAAGTLVVVRRTGVDSRFTAPLKTTSNSAVHTDSSSPALSEAAPPTVAVGTTAQTRPATSGEDKQTATNPVGGAVLGGSRIAGAVASPEPRVDQTEAQKKAIVRRGNAELQQRSDGEIAAAPAPPLPVPAAAPPPAFQSMDRRANTLAMDAAAQVPAIRVVGTPRAIGEKVTLYEAAPGDTVKLVEPMSLALDQVVVTGMGATRVQAGQPKAALGRAAPTAKVATPSDTIRAAPDEVSAVRQKASTTSPAPATVVESSPGVSTIAWTDSTGRLIRLSGRHTAAELEGIRRRIERARIAAADSAKKNR